MKDKRILMILNEFPPTAQSGVQRGLKFLKYAVRFGWEAHVIAPKSPIRKTLDQSLMAEIPPEANVYRVAGLGLKVVSESKMVHARFKETAPKQLYIRLFWAAVKLINDLLFPYDKQIGWMPFALFKAIQLIRKHKLRNVFISAFPYSAFLVGIALKFLYKDRIFWIADYRDAWQFSPLLDRYVLPFRHRIICRTDDLILRTCDMALFTTEKTRLRYVETHSWLKDKSQSITNGFDEDDFCRNGISQINAKSFKDFSLVYMGKLHISYGSPIPLLEAMKQSKMPQSRMIHIGSADSAVLNTIVKEGYSNYSFEGYKTHSEALNYSSGADINLIILSDAPGSETWFPGKLFELIRIGKPILAIGPRTSVIEDVLSSTRSGKYCYREDIPGIVSSLNEIINHAEVFQAKPDAIKQYSREVLAAKLLKLYG
ncbi:MAG: hypothetical protein PHN71_04380 [Candidatus Cloacimonetes bacterium]|nr:hypothetical protein [Candidatus Cloacimonadota bacterium]MDD2210543.1 hypothetical protein [Candidatus Cloacimonadota bacterium]MDY0299399.1 hypothetical protein [Candidatus Cloacimonadaceae bacterium]